MNLQRLIDSNNYVKIPKGIYETSGIFIRSGQTIEFEDGVVIKASIKEEDYKNIKTRVAGINMIWYPALVNIIDSVDVTIKGHAIIDGNGMYWWNKYWGEDKKGGMRKEYDEKNIRWACDYDCKRPRGILIQNSSHITINDIESFQSGFWNFHVLYSHDVILKNIKVSTLNVESPSTDGIDIDSSYNVLIDNCEIDCYDDSICIKSGRDSDGLKTNKPSYNIEIANCKINKGFGITIGSEVSGGIYGVNIHDIVFSNTDCGFRIKSARSRKGYIMDITVNNIKMNNVKYLFNMDLEWNFNYNNITLPPNIKIKDDWLPLLEKVDDNIKNTDISNIFISNVKAELDSNYIGISRLFNIKGFNDNPMRNIHFNNLSILAFEYGIIKNAEVLIDTSNIKIIGEENRNNDVFDDR